MVWDLSTSRRDRVLSGIAADSLMQHFEATVGHRHQAAAVPGPAEEALSKGAHWAGEESSSALAMMGVSMLSIDADRLLVHSNQMTNASLQVNTLRLAVENGLGGLRDAFRGEGTGKSSYSSLCSLPMPSAQLNAHPHF